MVKVTINYLCALSSLYIISQCCPVVIVLEEFLNMQFGVDHQVVKCMILDREFILPRSHVRFQQLENAWFALPQWYKPSIQTAV
jgi:hypothetical protein